MDKTKKQQIDTKVHAPTHSMTVMHSPVPAFHNRNVPSIEAVIAKSPA